MPIGVFVLLNLIVILAGGVTVFVLFEAGSPVAIGTVVAMTLLVLLRVKRLRR